jgi:hypothetical protein
MVMLVLFLAGIMLSISRHYGWAAVCFVALALVGLASL